MNNLLTLAMIVRNEEFFLPQCLESVKGIVDDMVIVDTGSTDRTVAIAKSFGAKVVEIEWPDDFSKARNVGLDLVRTPWVLVMDADEELIKDDIPTLTQAIKTPIADAYNIRIVSVMDKAEHISESYVLRLFRGHPKVRFVGKVHEQVFPSLVREQMGIASLDARLLHKGYLNAVMAERDKTNRNRTLLEKHLKENPHDGYMLWQLAQTLMMAGDFPAALSVARRSLRNLEVANALWVLAQVTLARLLELNGEPKRALKALEEGQATYPGYTDFFYLEGIIRMNLGQWDQAEIAFKKCLELGEAKGFLMTDTGVGGFKSLLRLADTLVKKDRPKEALAYLLIALKNYPSFREAWDRLFTLLTGSTIEAVLDAVILAMPLSTIVSTLQSWDNLSENERNLLSAALARQPANPQS